MLQRSENGEEPMQKTVPQTEMSLARPTRRWPRRRRDADQRLATDSARISTRHSNQFRDEEACRVRATEPCARDGANSAALAF